MNSILKSIIKETLAESFTHVDVTQRRIKICKGCPNLKKNGQCKLCGCFIEIKAEMDYNKNPKNFFKVEKTHCPIGQWPYMDNEGNTHDNDKEIADYYTNLNL